MVKNVDTNTDENKTTTITVFPLWADHLIGIIFHSFLLVICVWSNGVVSYLCCKSEVYFASLCKINYKMEFETGYRYGMYNVGSVAASCHGLTICVYQWVGYSSVFRSYYTTHTSFW